MVITQPPTRGRLLTLLSEACELEHALSCSYLFAAFSLKKELAEGLTWQQQQLTRKWAGQLFHIAAQEMLHLAQAWNLLTAVGGTPYYWRPAFPRPARWFELPAPLVLRRYDSATLKRFICYEAPAAESDVGEVLPIEVEPWPYEESFRYLSVGELYGECARIIRSYEGKLFLRSADDQTGAVLAHFTDLVSVHDTDSALEAIERITTQGEGSREDRGDSHYGIFNRLLAELDACGFDPARPVGDNPFVFRRRQDLAVVDDLARLSADLKMTRLSDETAERCADLFDDAYVAMLQGLAYMFSFPNEPRAVAFSQVAIELMTTVLRPLGEALCQLPSGDGVHNAGPGFSMWRAPALSVSPEAASSVLAERLRDLSRVAKDLVFQIQAPIPRDQVRSAAMHLERLAEVMGRSLWM